MRSAESLKLTCGACKMSYSYYLQLVEHLYWRHGTESRVCHNCEAKRWPFAAHICHLVPGSSSVNESEEPCHTEQDSEFCICRRNIPDAPMIGCDGPSCPQQWYHFACIGVTTAPDGDWLCPICDRSQQTNQGNPVKKLGYET